MKLTRADQKTLPIALSTCIQCHSIPVSKRAVQNVAASFLVLSAILPAHKLYLTGFTEHWKASDRVSALNPSPYFQSKLQTQ